jgi:hypothetical protein
MMSSLSYIRPIPNIDGTVRDIWKKREDGRFDYAPGISTDIDADDMDVRHLVSVLQQVTKVGALHLL